MQIDIKSLKHAQGAAKTFAYSLDLDWYEELGQKPFDSPLAVSGSIEEQADALYLEVCAKAAYHSVCDRCLEPVDYEIPLELRLRIREQQTDREDEVYAPGGVLDVDQEVISALVLALPTRRLCREDCKGLCPECGANLNIELSLIHI